MWRELQCKKSTPNDRFFEKLFMAILFYSQSFARNLLRANRWRNTFCILFWCLAWRSNPAFKSNKPTHYLLDYGDFTKLYLVEIFNLMENWAQNTQNKYVHRWQPVANCWISKFWLSTEDHKRIQKAVYYTVYWSFYRLMYDHMKVLGAKERNKET